MWHVGLEGPLICMLLSMKVYLAYVVQVHATCSCEVHSCKQTPFPVNIIAQIKEETVEVRKNAQKIFTELPHGVEIGACA